MAEESDPYHAPQRLPVYQRAIGNVIDLIFLLEYDRIDVVSSQEVESNQKKRTHKILSRTKSRI